MTYSVTTHEVGSTKKHIAIFLVISLGLASCDPPGDDRLWIQNQSSDTLFYCLSYNGSMQQTPPFNRYSPYLLPGERYNDKLGTGNREISILAESPDSSLVVYTFLKKDVVTNSWDDLKRKKLYQTSRYPIDEIERLDWHLPIPRESKEPLR